MRGNMERTKSKRIIIVSALILIMFVWTMALKKPIEPKAAFVANHYDLTIDGGYWNGIYYELNGNIVKNAFFTDGTYTYFLQADGTPMTDRLTYHPDGIHVIYFDSEGHEVFSNFAHVKKSISGDAVDDLCFFDVYGYMYVNFLTFNQDGTALYYANPYGVMECSGWFQFAGDAGYVAEAYGITEGTWAYAAADGKVDPASIGNKSTETTTSTTKEPLTKEQAYDAVVNYCAEQNPGLEETVKSGRFLFWQVCDLDGDEYVVTYRSYTGAYEYFHVNIYTGNVYSYQYVRGIIDEPELTGTNFNAYDYLYENTVWPYGADPYYDPAMLEIIF
ncbi:MAG: hypothetical protein IJ141_05125 [Lachnospiraceae bacterium]|nr:hypothetical protein [Lachnospiraceae bacterium]